MITPEQARELGSAETSEVTEREQRIDSAIRQRLRLGMGIFLSADLFGKGRVKDRLVKMYEGAGWVLKFDVDRNEPYVEMK